MKNKGKRIRFVLVLLSVLLVLAGCSQGDLVILGVEPGQPGPTSGQMRITYSPKAFSQGDTPVQGITIKDVSLTADASFTATNEDTHQTHILTNLTIDPDPGITYADPSNGCQVGILIPYTLEPGNYQLTAATGAVNYKSERGMSSSNLQILNTASFTIAA